MKETESKKEIEKCQEKNKINSCLKCKECVECEIRNRYVEDVYKSMNPDMGNGGFSF